MSVAPIDGKLVQAVFGRVLAADLGAQLKALLVDDGLILNDPTRQCPRPVWYAAIERTAEALFPGEGALRRLGRHIVAMVQQRSLVKGPWLGMARLLGPRRALRQGAEHSGHGPVRWHVAERSKREVEVRFEELEQPEFLAGLLEGAIELVGGENAQVVVEGVRDGHLVMAARWR